MPSQSRETIKSIQHALARRGFDPGVIDGIWGRRTENAVRAFQQASGTLLVDGVVGPKTWKALFNEDVTAPKPEDYPGIPWFQEARRLIGVKEVVGPKNNPRIIDWAEKLGIDYRSDDIAWCGLFVAHCVSSTLAHESLPANPLGARQWRKFGAPIAPVLGSVVVFWRGSPTGWQGHVGFYAGEDSTAYHVLGGNQGNSVCITRIKHDRLLEARWPATAPSAGAEPLKLADGSTFFSSNEA